MFEGRVPAVPADGNMAERLLDTQHDDDARSRTSRRNGYPHDTSDHDVSDIWDQAALVNKAQIPADIKSKMKSLLSDTRKRIAHNIRILDKITKVSKEIDLIDGGRLPAKKNCHLLATTAQNWMHP